MRYKYILPLVLISISAMCGVAVATEVSNGESDRPVAEAIDNIELKSALPNIPEAVARLKIDYKNLDQKRSSEIAGEVLASDNLQESESDNIKSVFIDRNNEETTITVYKRGQLSYSTGKELLGMYKKEELLSKNQAKDVAEEVVQRFIDADILNKDTVDFSRSEVVNDEKCRYSLKDGKTECYASNQHVNVYLSYKGVKIDGAGGKLRVYLAKNGEMVGLINSVGKLVPVTDKKFSVITPEEAIEKLKKQGYRNITIEKMELVYNVPPPEDNAAFVDPAYKIKGVQHLTNGDNVGFAIFISAAK